MTTRNCPGALTEILQAIATAITWPFSSIRVVAPATTDSTTYISSAALPMTVEGSCHYYAFYGGTMGLPTSMSFGSTDFFLLSSECLHTTPAFLTVSTKSEPRTSSIFIAKSPNLWSSCTYELTQCFLSTSSDDFECSWQSRTNTSSVPFDYSGGSLVLGRGTPLSIREH